MLLDRNSANGLPLNTIQGHVLKSWIFLILRRMDFWRTAGAAIYRTISPELLPMDLINFRSHPKAA